MDKRSRSRSQRSKSKDKSAALRYKHDEKYRSRSRSKSKHKLKRAETHTNTQTPKNDSKRVKIDPNTYKDENFTNAKFSMSKDHENMIFPVLKTFMKQIELARELEYIRIKLGTTADFNLAECYKCFTTKHRPYLTFDEFMAGCKLFGVKAKKKQSYMNVYDKYTRNSKRKDRMNFQQFSDIFLCHDTKLSYQVSRRMPNYRDGLPSDKLKVFKESTSEVIAEVLAKVVYIEAKLLELQESVQQDVGDIKLTFQLLLQPMFIDKSTDTLKVTNKYLLPEDLQNIMNQFGFPADPTD